MSWQMYSIPQTCHVQESKMQWPRSKLERYPIWVYHCSQESLRAHLQIEVVKVSFLGGALDDHVIGEPRVGIGRKDCLELLCLRLKVIAAEVIHQEYHLVLHLNHDIPRLGTQPLRSCQYDMASAYMNKDRKQVHVLHRRRQIST